MAKKQTNWSRAYNEKSYDRLAITVPKGHKATVESAAAAVGESVNGYVQRAILDWMGMKEWPSVQDVLPEGIKTTSNEP